MNTSPGKSKSSSDVAKYYASLPTAQRALLKEVRRAILSIVPDAEECISYGIPTFKINGKAVAGIAGFKAHCSLFPMSGRVIAKFKPELSSFVTAKGTIRFTFEHPLSSTLLRKIIRARVAEIHQFHGKFANKK